MQQMLSGYGANRALITKFLDRVHLGKGLPEWDAILDLPIVVDVFLEVRFPTVIVCYPPPPQTSRVPPFNNALPFPLQGSEQDRSPRRGQEYHQTFQEI